MAKVLYVAEAPPGSGKTYSTFDKMPRHTIKGERFVYAVPTNKLAAEVYEDYSWDRTLSIKVINSDTHRGEVIENFIQALVDGDDECLSISHEALRLLPDDARKLLSTWTLILDEVPAINACRSYAVGRGEYETYLEQFIDVDKEGTASAKQDQRTKLVSIVYGNASDRFYSDKAKEVYQALLNDNAVVKVSKPNADGGLFVSIVDYHDYLTIFEKAGEVHILANNVTDTLLGKQLAAKGWEFKESEFTPKPKVRPDYDPAFDGELEAFHYACPIRILPLLQGDRWSKSLCNFPGSARWTPEAQVNRLIANAHEHNGEDPILVFQHKWLGYEHPEHAELCSLDSRGQNKHRGVKAVLCLQHGNMNPTDQNNLSIMEEMLGVPCQDIEKAVHYERFYESTLQCCLRSAIRDPENKDEVRLYVQNEDMAEFLRMALGHTTSVDRCLLTEPSKAPPSAKQISKAAKKKEAYRLVHDQGMTTREAANELGVSQKTVSNWTSRAISRL